MIQLMPTKEFDKIKIISWRSSNSCQFRFELFDSGSEGAVQKFSSCVNLKSSQNCRVHFVWKFESDVRFVLFNCLHNFLFLTFTQLLCWDDSDVFFLVQNFAVGNKSFNYFFQIAQSDKWTMGYLPASTKVSKKLLVTWWYCWGANDAITSLCWFLLMAEFLRNSLIKDYCEMTLLRWVKSLRTTSRA